MIIFAKWWLLCQSPFLFECELALLVALEGESIWKGGGSGGDVHWVVCSGRMLLAGETQV